MEVEIPHRLLQYLGMTSNKQEYTRFENVLQQKPEEYIEEDETSNACLERIEREDNNLSICLRIAWKTQELWNDTKKSHLNMRIENKKAVTEGEKTKPRKKRRQRTLKAKPRKQHQALIPLKRKSLRREERRQASKSNIRKN